MYIIYAIRHLRHTPTRYCIRIRVNRVIPTEKIPKLLAVYIPADR